MARARRPGVRSDDRGRRPSSADRELIARAEELLRRRYLASRSTVSAAVRTRSGSVYLGVNLNGIHGPCAEPVALGAAVTAGDREIEAMVAVHRDRRAYEVLPPCGNCRQLLFDYAPRAYVLVPGPRGEPRRLGAEASLPFAYSTFDE